MGAFAGPKRISPSDVPVVFYYDSKNPKSYVGRPLSNYAYKNHARIDESYANYQQTATAPWPDNHSDAITVYNELGTNITGYVNTGVTSYESTSHAIWVYDTELKRPVVIMRDWDAAWKAKNFGTTYTMTTMGLSASDNYTISWLQWTTNTAKSVNPGLYGKNNVAANGFHDGLAHSVDQTSTQNTKTHTWERVHCTYTVASDWDFTASLTCYMYGYYAGRGTLKMCDVQIEADSAVYSGFHGDGTLTRSNTEAFLDPLNTGITITANSLTYADHPGFSFNGSSDYMSTSTIPAFTTADEFTLECVIKPDDFGANGMIITPTGLGIDRWLRITTAGKFDITLTEIADTNQRTFTSTGSLTATEYVHLAVVVNGTNIRLFINGELDSTQTDTSGAPCGQWGGYTWYIGQRSNSTVWFDGEIPMVAAYDGVLTDAQIKRNFLAIRKQHGI